MIRVVAKPLRLRSVSRSSEGEAMQAPYRVFRRSASLTETLSPRATSLVTWMPPRATASTWMSRPPENTPTVVEPPPKSTTAAPSSASSSTSVDKPGGVGRRHHRLDPQMAAFDDQHQVARRRRITGGEMKIDAEFGPDHALGVAHVLGRVEPKGGRKRMQDGPTGFGVSRPPQPRARGEGRARRQSCR